METCACMVMLSGMLKHVRVGVIGNGARLLNCHEVEIQLEMETDFSVESFLIRLEILNQEVEVLLSSGEM